MCIFFVEPDTNNVENVVAKPSPAPTPEPATENSEDHVENINVIFIGHVGKVDFSADFINYYYFYIFILPRISIFLIKKISPKLSLTQK